MAKVITDNQHYVDIAAAIRTKNETETVYKPSEMASAILEIQSGVELNFEVVGGTTQPDFPAENTIWIKTDTEINGWKIGDVDPSAVETQLYKDITLKNGYYLDENGNEVSYSTWNVTSHIALPVNSSKIVVSVGSTTSSDVYHIFYDASGSVLSRVTRATGETTYTVPDGAATVRLSIRVDDANPSVIATHSLPANEGAVWIEANTVGYERFNSIKDDNAIFVCPISAKQFVAGAWDSKPMKIYQDSTWKTINIHIIRDGVMVYDRAVGTTSIYGTHYRSGRTYVVKTNTNDNYAIYFGPFDLKGWEKIVIDIETGISWYGLNVPALAVCSGIPQYSESYGITATDIVSKVMFASNTAVVFSGVKSIPIDLTGKYYIAVVVGGSGNITSVTGNNNGYVYIKNLYIE